MLVDGFRRYIKSRLVLWVPACRRDDRRRVEYELMATHFQHRICPARRFAIWPVVPAKRRDPYAAAVVLDDAGRWLSRYNKSLWLWVPAFAGTTA